MIPPPRLEPHGMPTDWWNRWPGVQDLEKSDPWVYNHRIHWGKPAVEPIQFLTNRLSTSDKSICVFSEYGRLCHRIADHRRLSEKGRKTRSEHFQTGLDTTPDGPVLITGTPGTGKSVFIYYYAVTLMRESSPFVMYTGDYYLVTPDGVKFASPSPSTPFTHDFLTECENVPFLFDIDAPTSIPHEKFFLDASFFFVQAASPNPANFRWAKNNTNTRYFVMNPPTVEETIRLLQKVDPTRTRKQLRWIVEAYGPSIRMALHALKPASTVLSTFQKAVNQLRPDDLEGLFQAATSLQTHVLIKTICPDPPTPDSDNWLGADEMVHVLANATAVRLVLERWYWVETDKTRNMIERLSNVPQTYSSAGWLFESWVHAALCAAGSLALRRMVLRNKKYYVDDSPTTTTHPFPKLQCKTYRNIDEVTKTDTYYVPTATNNPIFDSFCRLQSGAAYAFQMTLAQTHTLKKSGLDILRTGMRGSTNKNIVFVVLKDRSFSFTPPPNLPAGEFQFFVLHIDIEDPVRSAIASSIREYWDTHERDEDADEGNEDVNEAEGSDQVDVA